MATTRHKSLVENGGRKALLEILHTQKKNQKKPDIHESKEKSFKQSYQTIFNDVIKATSINRVT